MKFSEIDRLTRMPSEYHCVPLDAIEDVLRRYEENYRLDINPEFQRGHVWDEPRQVSYVEYLLRGGSSRRDIIFNCPYFQGTQDNGTSHHMVLVDGLQRLTAVRKFVANELMVFGGVSLHDFKNYEAGLIDYHLVFYVNKLKSYKDVLRWYIELNSGGVVHTDQEIERVRQLINGLE